MERKKRVADYRELLRAGRWFCSLPEPFQEALIRISSLREVGGGERLFARGEDFHGMFGVLEGQLRASGTDSDGRQALLTIVEPPGWVGEIPLFDDLPRTHDLTADGPGLVVFVPKTLLLAVLEEEPRYWRDLARLLTGKLRLAFIGMEDTVLLPIAARLARRLVLIAEGYGEWVDGSTRRVEVSQEKLATMLSTSRQTVNQQLKTFESSGLVRLAYGRVEVIDLAGLRRVVSGEAEGRQAFPPPRP
jgi:CRP/FNR family transcriptional regulator, cyclic AMP receptor protein